MSGCVFVWTAGDVVGALALALILIPVGVGMTIDWWRVRKRKRTQPGGSDGK